MVAAQLLPSPPSLTAQKLLFAVQILEVRTMGFHTLLIGPEELDAYVGGVISSPSLLLHRLISMSY